ncbi:hypothetical protein GYO_1386 [Bacillus spizizenii TU-B-10]|uniref:Uncharacterized protein n=1 Tax=Bacillus spizizenii (strain DSM 15029 / JCM 12233 / NBRC 101239 / NRRL B-23049 / TU-B-10) TaxID=1052585 RepID=G4NUW3_BACS4|nr:hypothetical protein GYO_1386 [Bacillus spizizenii TU-B-10]SCV44691.1 hypothetical protein BQ1740_4245 [Bacillus subtilis]
MTLKIGLAVIIKTYTHLSSTKQESAFSSYTIGKKHNRLEEAVIHRSEKK